MCKQVGLSYVGRVGFSRGKAGIGESRHSYLLPDSGQEWGVLDNQMSPYQDEPLADVDESADDGEEADEGGSDA